MLDRWTLPLLKRPWHFLAIRMAAAGIKANEVTLAGFTIGLLAVPLLATQHYLLALLVIALNRIADGLDGELARLQGSTDHGAFLDIVLDFIFYAAVVLGFALAAPQNNALAACALLFGFMGTGSSFLAFAIMAEKLQLKSLIYQNKGFHYLDGLAEGTETILFFVAFCLLPEHFTLLAWVFAGICYVTTATRVWSGFLTIQSTATRGNVASHCETKN
ncbi:CDP-alcohol phosphatidyltransferase family protein [Gynuella sp.]|uniref:CDP-alcohol phosphatidyltransferase family protein n=1 Tax=Gynuella sp. TaxID=2969146 RepID=UPI003D0EE89B